MFIWWGFLPKISCIRNLCHSLYPINIWNLFCWSLQNLLMSYSFSSKNLENLRNRGNSKCWNISCIPGIISPHGIYKHTICIFMRANGGTQILGNKIVRRNGSLPNVRFFNPCSIHVHFPGILYPNVPFLSTPRPQAPNEFPNLNASSTYIYLKFRKSKPEAKQPLTWTTQLKFQLQLGQAMRVWLLVVQLIFCSSLKLLRQGRKGNEMILKIWREWWRWEG